MALISKVGKEDMVLFQKNLTNRQSRRLVESRERGKICLCFLPPLNPILGDSDFILGGIEEFFLQSLPSSSLPLLQSPQPPQSSDVFTKFC